jgi:putative transcriptional regulator
MKANGKLRTKFRQLLAQKEISENKRYSVAEIARQTGLTRAAVYPWMSEEITGANFETIEKLCEFLACEPGDLLDYTPLDEGQAIAELA